MFEILEHPADIGFRVFGSTPAELFENAAAAMLSLANEPERVAPRIEYSLRAFGSDHESMLVDWLSEVLYWFDGKRVAFASFHITRFEPPELEAVGRGEPRDPQRHAAKLNVKAVTWHQLKVEQRADGWVAEVYLDI